MVLICTPTGQSTTQPGLAHSMHREASVTASSTFSPRFTSAKLRLRTSGSSSGMCLRRIFMRSLSGRTFIAERGRTLFSDIMFLPRGQLRAQLGQLLFHILLELLERCALLLDRKSVV